MKLAIDKKYLPSRNFLVSLGAAAFLVLIAIIFTVHAKPAKEGALSVGNATTSAADDEYLLPLDQTYEAEKPDLDPTQKMAEDLVSNIIASQPTDGQIDPDTANALVQNAMAEIPQNDFSGTTTAADLNLIPVNDATFSRDATVYAYDYFLSMKTLLSVFEKDAVYVNNAESSDAPIDKNTLSSIIGVYQKVVNTLIKIPIPATADSSIVEYHLNIVNDLETLIQIDQNLMNATYDGTSVFSNLALYNKAASDLTASMDALNIILAPQN